MEKSFYLINSKKIILFIFFLIYSIKNNSLCQEFNIPRSYIEGPLIYPYESSLKGITRLTPTGDIFSKYTSLELSLVNSHIKFPSKWLKDKIYDELDNFIETERLLKSKDSPLADPIFDQFKHLPIFINDTIEQLALNPHVFCRDISVQYNRTGRFFELNCTIPFGFFNNYLLMRLQFENNIWYFTRITTLNYARLQELLIIADSFNIIKN